ncbi:hypothetical protein DNTS_018587 [Danionella cerebrum]|uniref:Centrosomal protein of 128 kDa n=1 Tax=Danionella cerebrum TaxID=2873325 RepID=A0A553Q9K0_9TELE|nr:hypothetical protein DNTS_018587 [Danionella translucida]
MDSSSESDPSDRPPGHRSRARDPRVRAGNRPPRGKHASDLSVKIDTLANTLQDTSRNLNKVDRMLGQYKEHADDQADAMETLRESLEESIQHLRGQRRRSVGGLSSSLSTLHPSDLEDASVSDRRRYLPTSPLRHTDGAFRRRSCSAAVRFRDCAQAEEQIHSLHQSVRDLRSDQLRMGDDIDREISRRNRAETETKKMLESLAGRALASPREDAVSLRVERRLQNIEERMRPRETDRRHTEKAQSISADLQEALRRHEDPLLEEHQTIRERLQESEDERSKMLQELESVRKQLKRSDDGRDAVLQQMNEMRSQLLRVEKEHMDLQREMSEQRSAGRRRHTGSRSFFVHRREIVDEARRSLMLSGPAVLEAEDGEPGAQMGRTSEAEQLKRSIDRKEREKAQLTLQVEALSADLEQREEQQMQMLSQLKELQSRSEDSGVECARLKAQLTESETRREEVRSKAQEAIRQWKTKCKKLERQLQLLKEDSRHEVEKDKWSKVRGGVLGQQAENARRQLADALGCLAQREEDVRRGELDLAQARSRLLTAELELREARESARGLEEEAQKQISSQIRMGEENMRLKECLELQDKRREEDQRSFQEIQSSLQSLTAAKADLAARLTDAESARKELEKQLSAAQEESASLGRQLELQRQVHQRELSHLQTTREEGRAQQDRGVQHLLTLYQQEREELQALVRDLKSEALADAELKKALQLKLDRMKTECDKLTAQLSSSEEKQTQLLDKHRSLRREISIKVTLAEREEEKRRTAERSMAELQERLSTLQTEKESILQAIGAQIDSCCQFLQKDSSAKLQAITLSPGLHKDSHRWLAEVKTKLQCLCEEMSEREGRERRLRRALRNHKEQISTLKQTRDSELQRLLESSRLQEQLLRDVQNEKRGLQEKSRRKEDELVNLQDRVTDLETWTPRRVCFPEAHGSLRRPEPQIFARPITELLFVRGIDTSIDSPVHLISTRRALEHLEAVPEKLSQLEGSTDLEESQRQRDMVEQRYSRYKEIVGELQHQLEESKRRIQEYRVAGRLLSQPPVSSPDTVSSQSRHCAEQHSSLPHYLTAEVLQQHGVGVQLEPGVTLSLHRISLETTKPPAGEQLIACSFSRVVGLDFAKYYWVSFLFVMLGQSV